MEVRKNSYSDIFLKYIEYIVASRDKLRLDLSDKIAADSISHYVAKVDRELFNELIDYLKKNYENFFVENLIKVKNEMAVKIYCEFVYNEFLEEFEKISKTDSLCDMKKLSETTEVKMRRMSDNFGVSIDYRKKVSKSYQVYLNKYVARNYIKIVLKIYNLCKENANPYEYLRTIWPVDAELDNFIIKFADQHIDKYLEKKPETEKVMNVLRKRLRDGKNSWLKVEGEKWQEEQRQQQIKDNEVKVVEKNQREKNKINNLSKDEIKNAVILITLYVDGHYDNIDDFCQQENVERKVFLESLEIVKVKYENLYLKYTDKIEKQSKRRFSSILAHVSNVAHEMAYGIELANGSVRDFTYLDYKFKTDLNFEEFLKILKKSYNLEADVLRKVKSFVTKYSKKQTFKVNEILDNNYIYIVNDHVFSYEEKQAALQFMRDKGWGNDLVLFKQILREYLNGNLELNVQTENLGSPKM